MPPRRTLHAFASWFASAAFHLAAWAVLSWTLTHSAAEFSLESSDQSGEVSSVITASISEQAAVAIPIAPTPPPEPTVAEIEEPATPPATSAAWADARISHRPIVVRERSPRAVALANLDPLLRRDQSAAHSPEEQPKELPPICEEIWRRTTDLPKRIDFDAMEQLLQKVAAPTVAVIETDATLESPASVQGTKVDALPKPGPRNKPPVYPQAARLAGQSGRVLLTVVVAADGSAKDVRLSKSSGHAALDEAALEAVRGWRFEPAKRNGVAVELEIDVPIRFRLTP